MKIDEQARFYLKHAEQIQEWAKLMGKADAAGIEFFNSLRSRLLVLFSSWDSGFRIEDWNSKRDEELSVMMLRESWASADGEYLVGIDFGMELPASKFLFYRGVYVSDQYSRNADLTMALQEVDWPSEENREPPYDWYPVWAYITQPEDYWDDLGGYQDYILQDAQNLWDIFHPIIDKHFS